MDTLYYSNFCKHSAKVLQFIIKNNIVDKINAICVDKRTRDSQTGQYIITLQNGKKMHLPPNIHSVPSLLLHSNRHVIIGNEIIIHYGGGNEDSSNVFQAVKARDPMGFDLGNGSISEAFTSYSDNVMADKTHYSRDNFVNANHDIQPIKAEPEIPLQNKLSSDVTIDKIHNYRNDELKRLTGEESNQLIDGINQSRVEDNIRIVGSYPMSPQL